MKKPYNPQPIDTKEIELDKSLEELTLKLAKNVHDIWSQGRINEGWSYGEQRDDTKLTNPCLIEFEELSESEKEYDINTAMETLKLIIKLGYEINLKQ